MGAIGFIPIERNVYRACWTNSEAVSGTTPRAWAKLIDRLFNPQPIPNPIGFRKSMVFRNCHRCELIIEIRRERLKLS